MSSAISASRATGSGGMTTGQVYRAFDRVIRRVEQRMASTRPSVRRWDDAHVVARIVQRIVELTADGFSRHLLEFGDNDAHDVIRAGGLALRPATGEVALGGRQWIESFAHFVVPWGRLLGTVLVNLFGRAPRESAPATLVMDGVTGHEESDSRFVEFCRSGPIEPLARASRVIVGAPAPRRRTDPGFAYAARPLAYLAASCLRRRDRWRLLFAHLAAPLSYLRAVGASPLNALLGRDLAVEPAVRWLDRHRLIEAIVVSNSSFVSQPLWMRPFAGRNFTVHMLWYSQNFRPKVYAGEAKGSDLPLARHISVDVHWVWTEGFKAYLTDLLQHRDIRVVGPILWYLPAKVPPVSDASLKVAIFDVTPLAAGHSAFGAAKNYYTPRTIGQFVSDVVGVVEEIAEETGRAATVLLKRKRAPGGQHDPTYLRQLERLATTRRTFALVDHGINTFGLLEQCDLSVAVPYTSTAYIAATLGKPSIYYDPFAELEPAFESNEYVHFAAGRAQLKDLMHRLLTCADRIPE